MVLGGGAGARCGSAWGSSGTARCRLVVSAREGEVVKAAVVVLGTTGWMVALWIVLKWRGTRRPPSLSWDLDASVGTRFRSVVTRGAGSLFGAIVAGVLVIGLGGRLMMRVMAATSPATAQGAITDMDAVVGQVTVAGSVGFVAFVGVGAGLIGWLLRLVLRRWLPDQSMWAGLVGAGIGAGLLARGSSLLEPDSIDFVILSPAWLAVALILALIVTFGMVLGVLTDLLAERWPEPTNVAQGLWLLPLVTVVVVPPLALGLAVVAYVRARIGSVQKLPGMGRTDRFAPAATALAAVVGAGWTIAGAVEILAQ